MAERNAVVVAGRRVGRCLGCFTVILSAAIGLAVAQQPLATRLTVSDDPLTAEQLAVYRVVLHGWMENEVSMINLSNQTSPLPMSGTFDASECLKDLDLEPASPTVVHRFRPQDLSQLGSEKILLVDPERQSKEVTENDPGKSIDKGLSVEDAVRNGFAHGLVTLSEIRFDKHHKHAIVSYGFYCGSLCGNGGAVVLEKIDGAWQRKTRCADWIS